MSRWESLWLAVAGLLTCLTLPFALDINLFTPMLGGLVDYTPSSVPALRHWGLMIFLLGVLMVVAAFRPWLRFETLLFSTVEKGFIAYLFLSNLGQPWVMGYFGDHIGMRVGAQYFRNFDRTSSNVIGLEAGNFNFFRAAFGVLVRF